MSNDKRTRLFRVRKTIHKMLAARGYLVSAKELERDIDSFTEDFGEEQKRESLTILAPKRDDPSENIFVFFPDEEKVGVKTIKDLAKRMKDENVFRAIIVVQA